jgi:hypothetical protein
MMPVGDFSSLALIKNVLLLMRNYLINLYYKWRMTVCRLRTNHSIYCDHLYAFTG